ncbi:hypothetical protein AAGG74_17075 [Bacillus mexicanus]|uniref:hypothetical protein n=1 Tax=Bacillus mexicanus TaxID=2834415 RepID=UPI003D199B49
MKYLYSNKINLKMLRDEPETFENIKIYTWYAMNLKGLKPIDWFIMNNGTRISYKKILNVKERIKEDRRLNDYSREQIKRFNKGFDLKMPNCERCKKGAITFRKSWFNNEMICYQCQEEELKHPLKEVGN